MKMNQNLILALGLACSALLAGACSKAVSGPDVPSLPGQGEVSLTVRLGAPSTKVAAQTEANEKMIRNVQVFVFRAGSGSDAGNLEVAASSGFDAELDVSTGQYSGLTLKCTTGEREIWAVVNDSRDRTAGADAVATKADLLAQTHSLADARKEKLLMAGTSGVLSLREGKEEIRLEVKRLAASVVLESVRNDFLAPAYRKPGVFRVEDCYLLNVPGVTNFGGTTEPSALPAESWLARRAAEKAVCAEGVIYDKVTPKVVEYGASDTTPHSFYAYPNNCAPNEDATWMPRATLLVLEASLNTGGEWVKYYYPVVLGGGLQSNRQYRVSLTIHRPGSLDPNVPVRFDDVTPVIEVQDWDTGERYDQEI